MSFKMKSPTLICIALLLAFSLATTHALDITKLLGQYPEFSSFSKFLTDTQIAQQINSRNTITVLALDNGATSSIAGKPQDELKAILSTHVVLDYFDEKKLVAATATNELMTTLYQTSGQATNQQGFIKVALVGEGEVAFGSAVAGAPMDAKLVKTVVTQPYNISIIQITKPILFPGAGSGSNSASPVPSKGANAPAPSQGGKAPVPSLGATPTPPTPPGQGAKAPVPVPSHGASAPVPAKGQAPVPSNDGKAPVPGQGPVPSNGGKAPSPSSNGGKAPLPAQDAVSPVATPGATAPVSPANAAPPSPEGDAGAAPDANPASPGLAPAAGPAADGGAADAPATTPASSSSRTKIGLFGAVIGFASLLVAL